MRSRELIRLHAFGADDNATHTIGLRINKPNFWWLTLKEQKWSTIRERRGFRCRSKVMITLRQATSAAVASAFPSSPCLNRLIFQLADESDRGVVIYMGSELIV